MSFRSATLTAIWISLSSWQACSSNDTTEPQPAATEQSTEPDSDAQPSDGASEPDELDDATDSAVEDRATDLDGDEPDGAEDRADSEQPTDVATEQTSEGDSGQEDPDSVADEEDGDGGETTEAGDSHDSVPSDDSDSHDDLEATDSTPDDDPIAGDVTGDTVADDEPAPDVISGDDSSTDAPLEDVEPDPIEAIRELFPEFPAPDPCIAPPEDQAVFCGRVGYLSALSIPLPASGAVIEVFVDRGLDGVYEEALNAVAEDTGHFGIAITLDGPANFLVSARGETAIASSTVAVAPQQFASSPPGRTTEIDFLLDQRRSLECADGACTLPGGGLSLPTEPTEVGPMYGVVIDPSLAVDRVPVNVDGVSHSSLVYSALEARTIAGDTLGEFESPVTVCAAVPSGTHALAADSGPGSGSIDIDIWSWDETRGIWVPEGVSVLSDLGGTPIPEGQLDAVRSGDYAGNLQVCSDMSAPGQRLAAFQKPVGDCLTGVAPHADMQGAIVTAYDISDGGRSLPQMVDDSNEFTLALPDTESVRLQLVRGTTTYSTPPMAVSEMPLDACRLWLGDLFVEDSRTICEVSGTVVDTAGNTVSGASVEARDTLLSNDELEVVCGANPPTQCRFNGGNGNCDICNNTNGAGQFTLRVPFVGSMQIHALLMVDRSGGYGQETLTGCPTAPVTLVLDEQMTKVNISVGMTVREINWDPAEGVDEIAFFSTSGDVAWWITSATSTGMGFPLEYGVVPEDARQRYPDGPAAPLPAPMFDDIFLIDHYEEGRGRVMGCNDHPTYSRCPYWLGYPFD